MENITLQEAIVARHSVRQYHNRPIEKSLIDRLRSEIEICNTEGHLHIQLVVDEPQAFGSGMAKYGKFSGVSSYLAMVGSKDADEAIGYYGERLVLLAQQLGLNSCWVGLSFSKQPDYYRIDEGEKLHCVISLGYGITQGVQHPMRDISHFVKVNGNMPEWFRKGVEAAMLAPTAVNQQKFEFELMGDHSVRARSRFTLIGYGKIDLGIAKYHFEIGAGKENFEWHL